MMNKCYKQDIHPLLDKQNLSEEDIVLRRNTLQYCFMDCVLTFLLQKNSKMVQDIISMSFVCNVPLQDIQQRGQGFRIKSILVDLV